MKTGRYSNAKRFTAMLLSLVLVFSVLPVIGVTAAVSNRVADESTMDSWKSFFDPENISTEHAGGVWTDKSVFTNASAFDGTGITMGENSFLVALSALAANSILVGQSSTPTDTMFVLDISGSMSSSEINAMIEAANDAIRTLLTTNENNRVGVILYSNDAHVLLALDRYTGVKDDDGVLQYIQRGKEVTTTNNNQSRKPGDNNGNQGGQTTTYIDNNYIATVTGLTTESGTAVSVDVMLAGGTYIQGGLWKAWEQFSAVTDAQSIVRTPVVVLMSDGAPTFVTNDYAAVPDIYEYGQGSSSTNGDGFVTQLTAAYVKEQMKIKYGTTAYFYTLGLGVDTVTNSEIATAVLDPSKMTDGMSDYWDTFDGLTAGGTMNVVLGSKSGNNTTTQSITYNAAVDGKQNYVDKYFAADDASDLTSTFQSIVNEINLQSGYYPTRLDDNAPNYGGYITFVDEIGMGMEVKDVKGILIGSHLFSGAALAAALEDGSFGTREEPTTLGDNMVWALQVRLGIADVEARGLLGAAYTAGQLSYTSDSDFSNYIGWYGDANGNYLGFWQESDTAADYPEGAVYINKCYGMLGSTTTSQTTHASDMMYVAIQVATEIATGNQIVSFRIPAALLPVITYEITLDDADSVEEAQSITLKYMAADPIRLIYEVGVRSDLTEWNITEILPDGYQANADGTYTLYTNHWYSEETADPNSTREPTDEVLLDTASNSITYSYFVANEQNEHYYFTEKTAVLDADGNPVTSVEEGKTYYYRHRYFTTTESGTKGAAEVAYHLEEISDYAVQKAVENTPAGQALYVPAGTMRHATHSHDLEKKDDSVTGTYSMVRNQIVDAHIDGSSNSIHYELVYLGNNGTLTYTPAQGIKLTKVMQDGSTPDATFHFTVELSGTIETDTFTLVIRETDGTEKVSTIPAANKLNVDLKPGQTAFLLGLPVGGYTVTEAEDTVYQSVGSNVATGIIEANKLSGVAFTNEPIVYANLSVAKAVTYNKGVTSGIATFPVTVTFTKNGEAWAGKTVYVGGQAATTGTDGTITFNIQDNQIVQITNVPVGIAYTVSEGTLPNGYKWENAGDAAPSGTIVETGSVAVLNNSYTPKDAVNPDDLTLNIKKTLLDANGDPLKWENGMTFTFTLSRYEAGSGWVAVANRTVTMTYADYVKSGADGVLIAAMDLSGATFDHVGDYLYRVSETVGITAGMTYDVTHHDFRVWVSDDHENGQLYISDVEVIDAGTKIVESDDGWTLEADFENTYIPGSAKLGFVVNKTLSGRTMLDGEFEFTLSSVDNGKETLLDTVKNGKLGDVVFHTQTYTKAGTYEYVIRETPGAAGVGLSYDSKEFTVIVKVGTNVSTGSLEVTDIEVNGTSVGNTAADLTKAITFQNSYTTKDATLTLSGEKILTGRTLSDGEFSFNLSGQIGNTTINETVKNVGKAFTFSTLTFPAVGTYSFTVTEVAGSLGGVTYDGRTYHVVVTVTDDGKGNLVAAYASEGVANGPLTFRNTYQAAATDEVVLSGSKNLDGRNIHDGEFSFHLSGTIGSAVINETVTNAGNTFTFSGLTFYEAGTYTFTVSEAAGHLGGITYDDTVYTVTIVVEDDGSGKLKVASQTISTAEGNQNSIVFNNEYKTTDATLVLSGLKTLTGRALNDGEFSFQLTGKIGDKVIDETVVNDVHGKFTFSELSFSETGTYQFQIKEIKGNLRGVEYDTAVYTITVTVTDNGHGALVATADLNGENVQFFNKYKAESAKLTLGGSKVLINADTNESMDLSGFRFEFWLVDSNGVVVKKAYQDANGNFSFGELEFSDAGEYKYTIREAAGTNVNVTYDTKTYEVVITVTDDGNGALALEWSLTGESDKNITFENSYDATVSDPLTISGEKTLSGRDMADGEFSFNLSGKIGDKVINETVKNAGKAFTFSTLTFDKAGTYTFTVTEVPGTLAGVSYDNTVYTVTVKVEDKGGKLEVTSKTISNGTKTVDAIAFANSYDAEDATLTLGGNKTLTNADTNEAVDLSGYQFEFQLVDAEGNVIDTVYQDANGKFTFKELTFSVVGEFKYTISEVKGNAENVTYDAKVYQVVITVTDDGKGALTAQWVLTGEADQNITFANTYDPADPSGPIDPSPETGDEDVLRWSLMLGVSAVCLLAVLVLGKKHFVIE